MPGQTILLILVLLLIGGIFHIIPGLTRPDLFFAVTVDPEIRRTPTANRMLRTYRTIVWTSSLVAIALAVLGVVLAAIVIQTAGCLCATVIGHRRMLAHAVSPSPVIEVDLAAPRECLWGSWIVAVAPAVFLGAMGFWAAFHWDRLPPQLPVHWGIHGADRWVDTTPASVTGLLALHALMSLLLTAMALGLLHWSRRISTSGRSAGAERLFRRRMMQLLILAAYFLACPPWFALFEPSTAAMSVWGLALTVVMLVFTVSLVRGGQGGSRATAAVSAACKGDRTPDACWKWGLVYVNPADPSIMVEKRFGIGYTVNLGNRRIWFALALLVVLVVAGLVFLR